jgi:hypothetical protein
MFLTFNNKQMVIEEISKIVYDFDMKKWLTILIHNKLMEVLINTKFILGF